MLQAWRSASGEQRLERPLIGTAREQLVAVDQTEQRHRLASQRMDDVAIVDDMAVLAVAARDRGRGVRTRVAPRKQSSRSSNRCTLRRCPIRRDGTV